MKLIAALSIFGILGFVAFAFRLDDRRSWQEETESSLARSTESVDSGPLESLELAPVSQVDAPEHVDSAAPGTQSVSLEQLGIDLEFVLEPGVELPSLVASIEKPTAQKLADLRALAEGKLIPLRDSMPTRLASAELRTLQAVVEVELVEPLRVKRQNYSGNLFSRRIPSRDSYDYGITNAVEPEKSADGARGSLRIVSSDAIWLEYPICLDYDGQLQVNYDGAWRKAADFTKLFRPVHEFRRARLERPTT